MNWSPLVAATVFALAGGASLASGTHDHPGAEASQKLTLDQGRKWSTDEALRAQMAELRDAVDYAQRVRLEPDEYRGLGQTVSYRVARIVADCRLPAQADANLHVVVSELLAAADSLEREKPSHARKATRRAAVAMNDYGRHFDHPGWKPLP